jgi:hypothetical protein
MLEILAAGILLILALPFLPLLAALVASVGRFAIGAVLIGGLALYLLQQLP